MLSSFAGIITLLSILFLPGLFIMLLLKKFFPRLTFLDGFVASLVLSGCWNLFFFIPRLLPDTRIQVYAILTFALIVAAIFLTLRQTTPEHVFSHVRAFIKKERTTIIYSIITLLVGALLLGIPFHEVSKSRLQLNPDGGDVNLFLFKSHLLKDGFSIFDDQYADHLAFYPGFITAEVSLASLISGDGLALHAETLRIMLIVLIFFLIFALGKSLKLRNDHALFYAVLSLCTYHLWSHLMYFVPVGMGFFIILSFYYFVIRGFLTNRVLFWALAGLAGSLVVHTHPVHGVIVGTFSGIALIAYYLKAYLYKRSVRAALKRIGAFVAGTAFWVLLYIIPLIFTYQLKRTSLYHTLEHFDATVYEFLVGLLTRPGFIIAAIISAYLIVQHIRHVRKGIREMHYLVPASFLFLGMFGLAFFFRLISIPLHMLPIYIDAADYYTPARALAWTIITLFVVSKIRMSMLKNGALNKGLIAVFMLVMLFPSLFSNPPFFSRYQKQMGPYYRALPAVGDYVENGNINDPQWHSITSYLGEILPVYETVLFSSPEITPSIHSHLGRRVIMYPPAHSNLFLRPPAYVRQQDIADLYSAPSPAKWKMLLLKYPITHILWTTLDSPHMANDVKSLPYVKEIHFPNDSVRLFQVSRNRF